jgi:hypothetical protein
LGRIVLSPRPSPFELLIKEQPRETEAEIFAIECVKDFEKNEIHCGNKDERVGMRRKRSRKAEDSEEVYSVTKANNLEKNGAEFLNQINYRDGLE